ncbi:MAG TPA: A/G-specific adenine glycosylase [Burkholderiaceae bacterium]|nr:A/G-specific adenine glycosylase [Burkholderiaceae bacterium]
MSFADRVIRWQKRHGRRDLPWQGTRDAYRIWVSEIMLQQTQVAAVIPYYARFLQRFPDVAALASSPSSDVMAAWAGLGYYSRARNLHRCAQAVVERHEGRFPRMADELTELPGIGRSTAAAIAAFAFGQRVAILDGNVKRVFARHFGVEGYPGVASVERRLWSIAQQELPARGIETYTQGLMDLGATLCVRARPRCGDCPVATSCVALSQHRVEELPAPRPAKARPVRHATVAIVRDSRGALLLEIRPPTGIWGGLVSLPEFDAGVNDQRLQAAIAERFALHVELQERLPALRHEFSHYSLVMHPRVAAVRGTLGAASPTTLWLDRAAFQGAALPAPVRRLLRDQCGEA